MSYKIPLAILAQDKELKDAFDEIDKAKQFLDEAQALAIRNLKVKAEKTIEPAWDALRDILRKRNLLPASYDDSEDYLSLQDGVIFLIDKEREEQRYQGLPPDMPNNMKGFIVDMIKGNSKCNCPTCNTKPTKPKTKKLKEPEKINPSEPPEKEKK